MPDSLYDPGQKIRLSVRFKLAGALADPSTVVLKVKDPTGGVATYTYPASVSRDDTGRFHADLVPTISGRWIYKFIGSGSVEATTEETFRVREHSIAA